MNANEIRKAAILAEALPENNTQTAAHTQLSAGLWIVLLARRTAQGPELVLSVVDSEPRRGFALGAAVVGNPKAWARKEGADMLAEVTGWQNICGTVCR